MWHELLMVMILLTARSFFFSVYEVFLVYNTVLSFVLKLGIVATDACHFTWASNKKNL